MDYSQILTTLRINGLPKEASPEETRAMLQKAKYSEKDIDLFLKEHAEHATGTPAFTPAHHLDASDYATPVKLPPRRYKLPRFIRLIFTILIWAAILAGLYVGYFLLLASPKNTILKGIAASTDGTRYHTEFNMYALSPTPEERYVFKFIADADTTNPEEKKVSATTTTSTYEVSGSAALRFIGPTAYSKINALIVFGHSVDSGVDTWYKIPIDNLESLALQSFSPVDTRILAGVGPATVSENVATWLEDGTIVSKERPRVSLFGNRPVLEYTVTVDSSVLATKMAEGPSLLPLQADEVTLGPITITEDLLTRRVIAIEGNDISATSSNGGEEQNRHYSFRITYTPAPFVMVEQPANSKLFEGTPADISGDVPK